MNDLQNIIAKINKLRSLAGNNPNQHESEAAQAAADRLIQTHRLTQAQLESEKLVAKEEMVIKEVYQGGKRSSWRERVMWAVVETYGCSFFMHHSTGAVKSGGMIDIETGQEIGGEWKQERVLIYKVCGRVSDVQIVEYMFQWICSELERLGAKESKNQGVQFGKTWLEGAGVGVSEQFQGLKQEQVKQFGSTTAMVLLGNRQQEAKAFMYSSQNLRRAGSLQGATRTNGYTEGYTAGKNLPIRNGMGGKSAPKLK